MVVAAAMKRADATAAGRTTALATMVLVTMATKAAAMAMAEAMVAARGMVTAVAMAAATAMATAAAMEHCGQWH